jgi:glycosyltransferase involved in cell wall biosynthesis
MKLAWNAIVKNEAKVIERCVRSLLPHIDCAIVTDTGSTDSTPELLTKLFTAAGKSLELRYAPFEDFAQARNAALQSARISPFDWDYLLLVDADMELVAEPGWCNGLTGLSYDMLQKAGAVAYWNRRLLSRAAVGKYVGVTHEYLDVESAGRVWFARFIDHADGSSRPDKFKRDIELLEKALKTELNPGLIQRYTFYLAQSYFDAGDWDSAALRYSMRATMGGYDEECWNSQYHYAHCLDNLGDKAGFVHAMLRAYEMRPHRVEALYDLARHFRLLSENATSLLFSDLGVRVPNAKQDMLFVNEYVHKIGLKEEFAVCAYYDPERRERGAKVCNEVALSRNAGEVSRQQARYNQYWYLRSLSDYVPSFRSKRIEQTPPDGYAFTNPSVTLYKGKPVTLVRAVNYKISSEGHYVVRATGRVYDSGTPIHTRNFLLFPHDMQKLTELALPSNWPEPKFDLVRGLEDSRLFEWQGGLCTVSTVRELNPNGWSEMVLAPLSALDYGSGWKVILPKKRQHEKNWMPWVDRTDDLRFVYRLGVMVDVNGEVITQHDCGLDVGHVCGGTQVVDIDDITALAIVHEARMIPGRSARYYQHRFVKFRPDGVVASISLPFVFFNKQIEFAAGLVYLPEKGELLVSFGVRDEEAWLATMDLHEVLNFFVYGAS